MAQVKVYGRREVLVPNRAKWSELIHGALVAALKLPPDKRFQRFFPLDAEDFIHPADRSPAYTLLEISLFEGRSPEALKALLRKLMADAQAAFGMHPNDLEITIFESPKRCWGIRGKIGDELELTYRVDV
jgi:phenylpyruvate tautomerase PptA (4-oxalocrotonate tautomerase family)